MSIETSMTEISKKLIRSFAVLDGWFDQPDDILFQQPKEKDMRAADILKHVILINESLIEKLEKVSRENFADFADLITQRMLIQKESASVKGFTQTSGTDRTSLESMRKTLRSQLHRCLCLIDFLSEEQGTLYDETSASVKIDIHQNLWHISTFVEGHLSQLKVFAKENSNSAMV